jgi:pentatricopeptide repeat-containing protein PET309
MLWHIINGVPVRIRISHDGLVLSSAFSDRDRLFMWKEIVPQRRSYIKAIISNILHLSTFQSPSTSLHALLRYASTSTALSRASSPTADPLQYLRQSSYSRYFRPEDGWISYIHLRNANALDQLSLKQVLGFAERLINSVEGMNAGFDVDAARTWGLRLGDIMQDLQLRGLRRPGSLRDGCLAAQIAALRGDIQGALASAKQLSSLEKSDMPLLSVYTSCLLATWRYHGHAEALNFLEQFWSVFRRPAIRPPRAKDDEEVKATRAVLRDFTASLESPVDMIKEKAHQWPADRIKSVVRLLVEVLCHSQRPHDALAVDRLMEERSLRMQLNSRLTIVRALARAQDFAIANELFTSITDSVSHEDTSSPQYNSTALHLHALQGNVSEAQHYLAQLPAASETDKAMLMHASAHHGTVHHVIEQFEALFSSGSSGARPDVVHYTTVIYAHAQAEDFEGMNKWLDRMTQDGIQPDEYVYNTVLRSFAARGDIDSVAAILDQMRGSRIYPSVISYTIAMKLLANMRNPSAVELLYKRALREGIKPDRYMLTTLMNAHTEAGSWNGVIRVFDYFKEKQIPLTIEVYNTLLKAYVLIGAPFRVVAPLAQRMNSQGLVPDSGHTRFSSKVRATPN